MKNGSPKLSIITPVYNNERYLEAAASSVLSQTFSDFEFVLVNDGSTDGSVKLLDALAQKDSRVRVIHKENGGVSSARNAGLAAAHGEYVGWADADDLCEPNMFELLMRAAEAENADVVQCSHDRGTEVFGFSEDSFPFETLTAREYIERRFALSSEKLTNVFALWSKIFRRTLFDGTEFPVGRTHEDNAVMLRLVSRANKVLVSDKVLYHYIKRENSIITGFLPRKYRDMASAAKDNAEFLREYDPTLFVKAAGIYRNSVFHNCGYFYTNFREEKEYLYYIDLLKKDKKLISVGANGYEKLYAALVRSGLFAKTVMRNDFEPVQRFLRKIKHEE